MASIKNNPSDGEISNPPGKFLAQFGAIFYMIWAVIHFQAARSVYDFGASLSPSMAQGRILQDAWNLVGYSVFGFAVAISLNWRNQKWGYWINLFIISFADVGFIIFVLKPGYLPLWPSIAGPVFWLLGVFFSTAAYLNRNPR